MEEQRKQLQSERLAMVDNRGYAPGWMTLACANDNVVHEWAAQTEALASANEF